MMPHLDANMIFRQEGVPEVWFVVVMSLISAPFLPLSWYQTMLALKDTDPFYRGILQGKAQVFLYESGLR